MLAIAALVLVWAFCGSSNAAAEQFVVNTTGDEPDAVAGNEFCEAASGKCSLRAAIEEANAAPGEDEVRFEEEIFKGDAGSVIEPASGLPTIEAPLTISGGECQVEAGISRPCTEIAGDAGEPALKVEGTKALIELVAVTGAAVGIELVEAEEFFLRSNWLGTALDGSAAGDDVGVRVGPGSRASRVGGEGEGAGNLIANSSTAGLEIIGADNIRVLGNRFGVTPAGTAAAANATNVKIASTPGSVALENTIGTRLSPNAAATPACDGGCNLISAAGGDGIDLGGAGDPAVGTTIAGNQIGVDGAHAGAIPNNGAGILVGGAPKTVIGGSKAGEGNEIVAGTVAIEAGAAPALMVRGNSIGSKAGASLPGPTLGGIVLDLTGLQFPAQEAAVQDNEVGQAGGTGISLQGFAATIAGNHVAGGATGIRVHGEAAGSLVEGNTVSGTQGSGILIETNSNEVLGNHVADAGGAGIKLAGVPPFGISANVVGGDTAAAENTIVGSAGAAIEIQDSEESRNEVARNRGSGNAGPFINLIPAETGEGDPNDGIQPPFVASITGTLAAGFAEPGAEIRVFRKLSPAPGEIDSFLGTAVADKAGNWSLDFPSALPAATDVAATQTLEGGTSELSITAVPLGAGPGAGGPASGTPADRKPPRTRMLRQSRRVAKGGVARFAFTSNEAGSSFQCSLDHRPFASCQSPKKYRLPKAGVHLFRVRAIDPAGNIDKTPLRRRFEVVG